MEDIDLEVHLPVSAQPSAEARIEYVTSAEEHGYDRVWQSESWGREAVAMLTAMAERTDEIGLGSSIMNVYSRTPTQLAQGAATLQELSDGRFRLGLGPSGPAVIENWHGAEFDRPLRRTREYVEIIRKALAHERLDYDGEVFQLRGLKLRQSPPEPAPSIDTAGMGEKMVELAGRFANGWHGLMFTPDGLRERLADLQRGAELGDRDPDDVRVTLSLPTCALSDAERANELGYRHVAFYLGGMGTYYRDALADQGHPDVAHAVYDAWQDGERERAIERLREVFAGALCASGSPAEVREVFESYAAVDGLDAIAINPPRGCEPADVTETLAALAPE